MLAPLVVLLAFILMLGYAPMASGQTSVEVNNEIILRAALSNPSVSHVRLTGSFMIMGGDLALNHNIVIDGQGRTIDMGSFRLDTGTNDLTLANRLIIRASEPVVTSEVRGFGPIITGTGRFIIDRDADVTIIRPPGILNSSQLNSSALNHSMIDGYSEYLFREGSKFTGQSRTNRLESNKGTLQTAVIRSMVARSFVVERNAKVNLISDYSSPLVAEHGSTALILRKPRGGQLNITVQENAELNVTAYGTDLLSRDRSPVLILHEPVNDNTGVSRTMIKGTLNVTSNNGNGWYYQYIDYQTMTSDYFTVDGGVVNIKAMNNGTKGKREYGAFESYGRNPMYITVENGGQMTIQGSGYRGFSLAAGGSYVDKSIVVKGSGSKLSVYGCLWAIAAETQPNLTISALDGGEIYLESAKDDVGPGGFSGSTVYSVGPTTYNVIGEGSRMDLLHYGGEYGAIFADGYGELKINVTDGGYMYVYSKNTGNDLAARRATICAQSGLNYFHAIRVDGWGSKLEVINDNTGRCNDKSLYPRSAVALAANTSGSIYVTNGGNFYASNNNADSPTIALGGYGTNNTNGKLVVNYPGEIDIRNDAATNDPAAVALRSTNYLQSANGNTKIPLEVSNTDSITVWPIGKGPSGWQERDIYDIWNDIIWFTAPNNVMVSTWPMIGEKWNTTFKLSDYGRIGIKNYGSFDVTFEANGGLPVPAPQNVAYREKVVEPVEPTKYGYTFGGWYANPNFSGSPWDFNVNVVVRKTVLYAKWDIILYNVNYYANGGVGAYQDLDVTIFAPYQIKSADETAISNPGSRYIIWNTEADGTGVAYNPGDLVALVGDLDLYAQWVELCSAVYHPGVNGTGGMTIVNLDVGGTYTIESSEAAGVNRWWWNFDSWNTELRGLDTNSGTAYVPGQSIILPGDMLLYAQWYQEG